jgi:hypothetical protein
MWTDPNPTDKHSMDVDPSLRLVGICHDCRHRSKKNMMRCEAFPDGIPAEILVGTFDHHKPYKGDHGIQFESVE